MKCTQCGNGKLFKIFNIRLEGEADDRHTHIEHFDSFACDKCGHVEFYVSQEALDKYALKQKEDIAEAEFNKEKAETIERIVSEIQNLKVFIADENNTVKAVKEAENSLAIKEQELKRVKSSFYHRKDEQRPLLGWY